MNSLLEGAAARSIQGLRLTESNYDAAIALLQERFGRPQCIIAAHIDELLKIPGSISDRAASLRFVHEKITAYVHGLESLCVASEQYGSLLIPIIMSKLPNDIRLPLSRQLKGDVGDVWKLEDVLLTIGLEIKAREAGEVTKASFPNDGRKIQHGG